MALLLVAALGIAGLAFGEVPGEDSFSDLCGRFWPEKLRRGPEYRRCRIHQVVERPRDLAWVSTACRRIGSLFGGHAPKRIGSSAARFPLTTPKCLRARSPASSAKEPR